MGGNVNLQGSSTGWDSGRRGTRGYGGLQEVVLG